MFIIEKQNGTGIDAWPKLINTDRDLTIRAIKIPGYPDGGEPIYKFELLIGDNRIVFEGSQSERFDQDAIQENGTREFHLSWMIRKLKIPEGFVFSEDELKEIISEALQVWGRGYNQTQPKSFRINFSEIEMGGYLPHENVYYWN